MPSTEVIFVCAMTVWAVNRPERRARDARVLMENRLALARARRRLRKNAGHGRGTGAFVPNQIDGGNLIPVGFSSLDFGVAEGGRFDHVSDLLKRPTVDRAKHVVTPKIWFGVAIPSYFYGVQPGGGRHAHGDFRREDIDRNHWRGVGHDAHIGIAAEGQHAISIAGAELRLAVQVLWPIRFSENFQRPVARGAKDSITRSSALPRQPHTIF